MCEKCCCCCDSDKCTIEKIFKNHPHFDHVVELDETGHYSVWINGPSCFIHDEILKPLHRAGFYITEIHLAKGYFFVIHVTKSC